MSTQPTDTPCQVCFIPMNSGGNLVSFGSTFFHADCFQCSKCQKSLQTESSTVLIDEKGGPLCIDCGYRCDICKNSILDEAIATGGSRRSFTYFQCFRFFFFFKKSFLGSDMTRLLLLT